MNDCPSGARPVTRELVVTVAVVCFRFKFYSRVHTGARGPQEETFVRDGQSGCKQGVGQHKRPTVGCYNIADLSFVTWGVAHDRNTPDPCEAGERGLATDEHTR